MFTGVQRPKAAKALLSQIYPRVDISQNEYRDSVSALCRLHSGKKCLRIFIQLEFVTPYLPDSLCGTHAVERSPIMALRRFHFIKYNWFIERNGLVWSSPFQIIKNNILETTKIFKLTPWIVLNFWSIKFIFRLQTLLNPRNEARWSSSRVRFTCQALGGRGIPSWSIRAWTPACL